MPGGCARPAGPPPRSPPSRRGRAGSRGRARITQMSVEMGAQRGTWAAGRSSHTGGAGGSNSTTGPARPGRPGRRDAPGAASTASPGRGRHTAPARAPGIPRGRPGAGEPGRCVARAAVPGRVGERLDRQHDLVVQVQVVPGSRDSDRASTAEASCGHRRAARRTAAGRPASAAGPGDQCPTSRSRCPGRCTAAPPTRTPAARPRRRPAPRRAGPPTRTGARRASDGPPAADRTGPSQRVTHGRTVRSRVHEATPGILPVTRPYGS